MQSQFQLNFLHVEFVAVWTLVTTLSQAFILFFQTGARYSHRKVAFKCCEKADWQSCTPIKKAARAHAWMGHS